MGAAAFRGLVGWMLLLTGCQLVGDIGERELACRATAPITTGPRARVANLAVDGGAIEICSSNGQRLPVVADECPKGVNYAEVSTPARVTPGVQQVRVVPAGTDCNGSSLFEGEVELSSEGTTLAWIGGGSREKELIVLPETVPEAKARAQVRLIHAATDLGALDGGRVDARALPASLAPPSVFLGIEFGKLAPEGALVTKNGYTVSLPLLEQDYGAALAGETEARFVSHIQPETAFGHAFTIFAIGGDGKPHQSLLCDEQRLVGDRTHCTTGTAVDLSFETFDAVLAGLLVPYADERKAKLEERIVDFDSDVVCLPELWPESTKQAIASAAKAGYPYQYSADYDPTSPFTDPSGPGGTPAPAPRSEPYCATDASKQKLEELLDCLRTNCAAPATDAGLVQESSCPTTACISESQALVPHLECGLCAVYLIGGSSLAKVREGCTVLNEPYPFDGASGLLLLSRYPIEEPSAFLAPSTLVRRDVLHARVRHPAGGAADVYCGHSPQIPAAAEIYPGVYGNGANGVEAWRNERKLFDEKLRAWVDATGRAPRSVVMGVFGTSPSGTNFEAIEPDVYALLTQRFPLAAPPSFVPSCTLCDDNPLVLFPAFTDFVLLRGAGNVKRASVTQKSKLVSVTDTLGSKLVVPLSSHYGFRSEISFVP